MLKCGQKGNTRYTFGGTEGDVKEIKDAKKYIYCISCGVKNILNASFCKKCGLKLDK